MSGLDMSQWIKDKCKQCKEEFLFWHESPFRICNSCERKSVKAITRNDLDQALHAEPSISYDVKGRILRRFFGE